MFNPFEWYRERQAREQARLRSLELQREWRNIVIEVARTPLKLDYIDARVPFLHACERERENRAAGRAPDLPSLRAAFHEGIGIAKVLNLKAGNLFMDFWLSDDAAIWKEKFGTEELTDELLDETQRIYMEPYAMFLEICIRNAEDLISREELWAEG